MMDYQEISDQMTAFLTAAKQNLEADGELLPIAFIFQTNGEVIYLPGAGELSDKYVHQRATKMVARTVGAKSVFVVCEAWFDTLEPNEEVPNKVEGRPTAKECIVIIGRSPTTWLTFTLPFYKVGPNIHYGQMVTMDNSKPGYQGFDAWTDGIFEQIH